MCAELTHSFEGVEIYWLLESIKLQHNLSFNSESWSNSEFWQECAADKLDSKVFVGLNYG